MSIVTLPASSQNYDEVDIVFGDFREDDDLPKEDDIPKETSRCDTLYEPSIISPEQISFGDFTQITGEIIPDPVIKSIEYIDVDDLEKLEALPSNSKVREPIDCVVDTTDLIEAIKNNMGKLIFRRVKTVKTNQSAKINTTYFTDDDTFITYDKNGLCPKWNKQQFEQNVEFKYSFYTFLTDSKAIRQNDSYGGTQIFGSIYNRSVLDIEGGTFLFKKDSNDPHNFVPPRIDCKEKDLVCGIVVNPKGDKSALPKYQYWFICSDQFLKAWTSVVYPSFDIFPQYNGEDFKIRKKLMTGNRLCTNTFKKWTLAHFDNKMDRDPEEIEKRYYRLRTETSSRKYVHLYAALILIAKYKELPCEFNLPVNLDKGPNMKKWDIPEKFVNTLIEKYNLVIIKKRPIILYE
jgi:hypothetical protein